VGVTGDEIVPAAARPGPAGIRNSNGPALEAMARAAGGVPVPLGTSRDRPAALRALARRGLARAEVLVLSGGVSAGDRDLVPPVLRGMGVREVFHRIDLRPGKPAWFGVKGRRLVFGLPGNPVSAQVTFALLVAPALAALRGDPLPGHRLREARLRGGAPAEGGRTAYRPARVVEDALGSLEARLVPWNGSGDLVGFARANALLRRAGHAPAARAGTLVEVLLLGEPDRTTRRRTKASGSVAGASR